ncbi:hypothetical protein [Flavobacterium croceum]|jgi:hypothetical protein|uniref:hypothetical protein n=1 Tax=Flavobacterium croceum TaxID=370975 RepID=UPI0024A9F3CE|nr:hypothetical protein [Flavobacterium croceum]
MFGKEKIQINAIQDVDLEVALRYTSQFQDLIEGKLLCKSCGTIITEKNIGVMQPIKKYNGVEIDFFCEKVDCVEEFKRNIDE